jgi:hypothetical protein
MGVRDFDVGRHQPHPPGYPVFIGLAKASTAVYRAVGASAAEVRGLAVWSAIGGAVLLLAMFAFSRSVLRDNEQALIATLLVAVAPLFWFTSLRPLSDVAGLAAAFVSLAAVLRAARFEPTEWSTRRTRLLLFGAVMAGLSIGFRSQMAILSVPLLAFVLVRTRMPATVRIQAFAALVAGGLAWAVPLLIASGGPAAYLRALGSQAGEDFSGVVMLWNHRTPRVAVMAMLNTFMLPWDSPVLAGIVLSLAAAGFLVLCLRKPRAAAILILVFGPYMGFHLLLQETFHTRYALPLVPLVAMLAAVLLAQARRAATAVATAALVVACLLLAVPAGAAFGRLPSPMFAALGEMNVVAERGVAPLVAMHRRIWSESRRARPWSGALPGRLLESPRDYEWLEVTRTWREGDESDVWFVADPRRTDLALIDSEHRRTREYRWPFDPVVYVGGARPDELDWHIYSQPGWFLEQGWALTPEIAGITERDGWGPHRKPSIGWIRRRPGETMLMIGGRHLGGPTEPPAALTLAIDGRRLATFEIRPGYFLEFVPVPAGALEGEGRFARLTVTANPARPGPTSRVALEQFNLQAPDAIQFGFADGWYEPEYNPQTARSWRWSSEAAVLQVHPINRDVSVEIQGESRLRYYHPASPVRVTAGGRALGEYWPEGDFAIDVTVPADVLTAAKGRVVLESSDFFIPGERVGSADRRHLALRVYSVRVKGPAR